MQKQDNSIQLIAHGAQAKIYLKKIQNPQPGKPTNILIKERLPKKYRHPALDHKINDSRVRTEVKNMKKAEKIGVNVPKVYQIHNYAISMEWIQGPTVKEYLKKIEKSLENQKQMIAIMEERNTVLQNIGKTIEKLHKNGLIHGDLTTSNMIIQSKQGSNPILTFIDFGLSYVKDSIQDKAVDLYVLEKAFLSTHPELEKQFHQIILKSYKNKAVLDRLEAVRQRGRKKIAFG